jgi:type II secretory pathway pseudopilin PulG
MKQNSTPFCGRPRGRTTGATLAEMMIAMIIFALVSMGLTTSLLQQRKQSEKAMSQVIAQSIAEGILEQIRRAGFASLSNFDAFDTVAPDDCPAAGTETAVDPATSAVYKTYRSVELKFIGVGADNYATVQTFNLYWATDNTLYMEVGERSDPDDLTSAMLGVVLDMDYKVGATVLRPRRYMKMIVNLTRTMNANKTAVEIVLHYQWAIPERRTGAGQPIYYSEREIRTIVSKIATY